MEEYRQVALIVPSWIEDSENKIGSGFSGLRRLSCSMWFPRRARKKLLSVVLVLLSGVPLGFSQGIATRGPTPPPEFAKALEQFNAEVAAWNKRCATTRSDAEEAWCKKERARIEARRTELIALGALPRR
jgi:hypothetical protein